MNIEDLVLTDDELFTLPYKGEEPNEDFRVIADAATAKALWGVADWLNRAPPSNAGEVLERVLNKVGLPRPGKSEMQTQSCRECAYLERQEKSYSCMLNYWGKKFRERTVELNLAPINQIGKDCKDFKLMTVGIWYQRVLEELNLT